MKSYWCEEEIKYDGSQLKSLYAYMNFGVQGDVVFSFRGPCDISFDKMLDGEDLREQSPIRGGDMLHFIIEKFNVELYSAVAAQRLFASIVMEWLRDNSPKAKDLYRKGDDLYLADKKLSISIAAPSPISCLIHFAVNVKNVDTPVPTLSLEDLGVDPKVFAKAIMDLFCEEEESLLFATQKVRGAL